MVSKSRNLAFSSEFNAFPSSSYNLVLLNIRIRYSESFKRLYGKNTYHKRKYIGGCYAAERVQIFEILAPCGIHLATLLYILRRRNQPSVVKKL